MRAENEDFAETIRATDDPVARAILVLANRTHGLTRAIHRLGNAGASTPMGGLRALGKAVKIAHPAEDQK